MNFSLKKYYSNIFITIFITVYVYYFNIYINLKKVNEIFFIFIAKYLYYL